MSIWHINLHILCVVLVVHGATFEQYVELTRHIFFPEDISKIQGPLAKVHFPSGGVANLISGLTHEEVKYQPTVKWDFIQDDWYTLCLIESEPELWQKNKIKGYLHWLVVNIPKDLVEEGETLAPYEIGLSLQEQAGLHMVFVPILILNTFVSNTYYIYHVSSIVFGLTILIIINHYFQGLALTFKKVKIK